MKDANKPIVFCLYFTWDFKKSKRNSKAINTCNFYFAIE